MQIDGLTGPQRTRRWIGSIASAILVVFVPPVMAQSFSGYSSIIIGASADRSDLRESMRREHRERVERGFSGNPDKPVSGNGGRPDQVNVGDPRENENAARRHGVSHGDARDVRSAPFGIVSEDSRRLRIEG